MRPAADASPFHCPRFHAMSCENVWPTMPSFVSFAPSPYMTTRSNRTSHEPHNLPPLPRRTFNMMLLQSLAFTAPVPLARAHVRFSVCATRFTLHGVRGPTVTKRRQRNVTRHATTALQTVTKPLLKRPLPAKKSTAKPRVTVEGDTIASTPPQLALLAVHFASSAAVASHIALQVAPQGASAAAAHIFLVAFSYVLTDFAVGVYHHAVDNYGNADTPIFGCKLFSVFSFFSLSLFFSSRARCSRLSTCAFILLSMVN